MEKYIMYVCPDCRKVFKLKGTGKAAKCPKCTNPSLLEDTGVAEEEWKTYSVIIKNNIISNLLDEPETIEVEDLVTSKPQEISSNNSNSVKSQSSFFDFDNTESINTSSSVTNNNPYTPITDNGIEKKKDEEEKIKNKKFLKRFYIAALAIIPILVIIAILVETFGVSDFMKTRTDDLKGFYEMLEDSTYKSVISPSTFHLVYKLSKAVNDEYNNLSDRKKESYEKWVEQNYGVSYEVFISKLADYGIDITKEEYTDEECEALFEAYKNNDYSAPYKNGIATGNVPDPGAKRYNESEINEIALDNGLWAEHDDYEEFYRYYSKRTANHYWDRPSIYTYIVNKGDIYYLKCVVQYFGLHWVFWDRATAKINGEIVSLPINGEPRRDTSIDANVVETYDTAVKYEDDMYNILKQISERPGIEVKFIGEKSSVKKLSEDDCKAIKEVLDVYDIIRVGKKE